MGARQAVPSLSLAPRALCVNVNTKWSDIPEDALETPSSIEPSVVRDVTPTESGVEVRANGRVVTIGDDKPFVFSNRGGIIEYFRVSKVGPRYYIEVPMLMLSFRYTGDEIVNIIPSTHRAQHCGMCGNYNGQVFDELVGPSGCAMKDSSDMAKSYVLRDKTCEQSIPV